MSLVELSLPPNAPSPLLGDEEVNVYVNSDVVQTTTTAAIAAIPEPVYTIMAGAGQTYTPPPVGGTIIVNKLIGSPTAITLPSVPTGTVYVVKDAKGDAATNPITITPSVGNIDGTFNYLINWPQGAVELQFNGSNWSALSNMASGGGGGVTAFNGRSGSVIMTATDITNAGGATISYVDSTVAGYLPLTGGAISGALSVAGELTAPTMPPGTNTSDVATTAFVDAAVVNSTTGVATWNGRTGSVVLTTADITGAGGATAAQLGGYLPLTGGAITGPVTAPTPAPGNNSTSLATTAFVGSAVAAAPYLPLIGGTLTGVLNVSPPSGSVVVNLNKPASGNYNILRGSTNGVRRWELILGDNIAETGANAGSNFELNGFDDTGNTNLGLWLTINRATGAATFNGSSVSGTPFTTFGGNGGYFLEPRGGSGLEYGLYNPTGTYMSLWDSSYGDIAQISSLSAIFAGGLVSQTYSNDAQLRMMPGPTAAGISAMWRNDGTNTYFLLTNNNDAWGQWNNLRPITINDSNGWVTVSNGFTANNIITNYGIVYNGYAGNVISFRWTGVLQIFVDGNYIGDIATNQSLAGNYLPLTGGTLSGALTVNNGNLTCPSNTIQGGDVRAFGYVTRAGYNGAWGNNHFNFNWVSPYMSGYVDNTGLGNISFSSDYRIKRNITNLGSMWDKVKALRPVRYNIKDFSPPGGRKLFIADDVERWGFLAHELQDTLIQDAATGVKDDPSNVQAPNPWTVIASLTRALQEAMARIEALEAKAAT